MLDLHHIPTGSSIDLLLIFLAFFAGRAIQYKESLYLLIFLLRLGLWIAKSVPKKDRKNIESHMDSVLVRILRHNTKETLKHDSEVTGQG